MKTVLITGATDGIGKQTAHELARLDYRLILHGRNTRKTEAIRDEIKKNTGNNKLDIVIADLSSQKSVQRMSGELHEKLDHLNILINNAGTFQRKHVLSRDGIEMTFAVNHLSVFSLTLLLLDLIKKSGKGRIINVSSVAHRNSPRIDFTDIQEINSYMDYSAYSLSKLGNILFTYELADRLEGTGITVNCLHPGVISTKLLYEGFGISGDPLEEGARTSVYLASEEGLNGTTGKYFTNERVTESSPYSYDKRVMKNLWNISEEITGISFPEKI